MGKLRNTVLAAIMSAALIVGLCPASAIADDGDMDLKGVVASDLSSTALPNKLSIASEEESGISRFYVGEDEFDQTKKRLTKHTYRKSRRGCVGKPISFPECWGLECP